MIANILQLSLYDFAGVRVEFLPPYFTRPQSHRRSILENQALASSSSEYYLATTRYGIIFDMYEVMDIINS